MKGTTLHVAHYTSILVCYQATQCIHSTSNRLSKAAALHWKAIFITGVRLNLVILTLTVGQALLFMNLLMFLILHVHFHA